MHDATMIALGFPPLQSKEAYEASSDIKAMRSKATKDAKEMAGYWKKAFQADEGSDERTRNLAYLQTRIDVYRKSDPSGELSDMLAQQFDKYVGDTKGYNIDIFEQVQKLSSGSVRYRNLVRDKK